MSTAVASFAHSVERHLSPPQRFTSPTIPSVQSKSSEREREPVAKRVRSNGSPRSPHIHTNGNSSVERLHANSDISPPS